jgi:ABC-type polysaccharide/polyol phosphate export permease
MLFQVMKFEDLKELGTESAVKVCTYSLDITVINKYLRQHFRSNILGQLWLIFETFVYVVSIYFLLGT